MLGRVKLYFTPYVTKYSQSSAVLSSIQNKRNWKVQAQTNVPILFWQQKNGGEELEFFCLAEPYTKPDAFFSLQCAYLNKGQQIKQLE